MPKDSTPQIATATDLLRAIREPGRDLRRQFRGKPLELAELFHIKFPRKPVEIMKEKGLYDPEKHGPIIPGLRELIEDVCLLRVQAAVVAASRGGGKSLGAAFIEFYLWMIELFDALNLGGSELQADQVYQYLVSFIESNPYWATLIKGDPLQSRTDNTFGAWIRVLASSQKSARSPHAGGRKADGREAGGLLVIDEEAEADPSVVRAALPTVNTARPSVTVRCSTFHNVEGTFAELIDHHDEMGYKYYHWGIFDVCEKCECKKECQSPEPCFREDHYEDFINPDTGQPEKRLVHRAYCGGRAMHAEGWIPMTEIEKLWKGYRRNHGVFEVEAMGLRPPSAGHVIRDMTKYARNIKAVPAHTLYEPFSPVSICVDWGTNKTGLLVWQEQFGGKHVLLHADEISEMGQSEIFGKILGYVYRYKNEFEEVAADIGGGGNYLNPKLREEEGINVRDVNFAEEKEAAAAAWNILNEAEDCVYPAEFEEFHAQVRNWRRKQGRIQKGNDHLCDAAVCYFSKFIERLGTARFRITPKSFQTGIPLDHQPTNHVVTQGRVPIVRSIGSRNR